MALYILCTAVLIVINMVIVFHLFKLLAKATEAKDGWKKAFSYLLWLANIPIFFCGMWAPYILETVFLVGKGHSICNVMVLIEIGLLFYTIWLSRKQIKILNRSA